MGGRKSDAMGRNEGRPLQTGVMKTLGVRRGLPMLFWARLRLLWKYPRPKTQIACAFLPSPSCVS
jgi:hypothetical protein